MRGAKYLLVLFCVGSVIVGGLAGCSAPVTHSTQAISSPRETPTAQAKAQPVTKLEPDSLVPSSCPVTPVYEGGPYQGGGHVVNQPWLKAEPNSSGITAYLAYSFKTDGTYRVAPQGGVFRKEGLYTKTFWMITHPQASSELRIDGENLSSPKKTFHDTGNTIVDGESLSPNGHTYTSTLSAPSPGCWRLHITSGKTSGIIVLWVVPN